MGKLHARTLAVACELASMLASRLLAFIYQLRKVAFYSILYDATAVGGALILVHGSA